MIHCHARYSILSAARQRTDPFNREARILSDGVPVFPDSRGIRNMAHAQQMVANLGARHATFLPAMAWW